MSNKPLPSAKMLRKLLRYEYATGLLFWRERTSDMFVEGNIGSAASCARWNKRYAGKEALICVSSAGYLVGSIDGVLYRAHRVIWAIVTGEWPIGIDHEDHDRQNNRWGNLREASQQDNMKNASIYSNNTSGFTGVSWHKRDNKWVARIKADGRFNNLGSFDDKADAIAARQAANIKYNFHENHGVKL